MDVTIAPNCRQAHAGGGERSRCGQHVDPTDGAAEVALRRAILASPVTRSHSQIPARQYVRSGSSI